MSSTKKAETLRLRVFAGPNGSGKSTIISSVRDYKVQGKHLDFGIYINADDIASALRKSKFDFKAYQVKTSDAEFRDIAIRSGLINDGFTEAQFLSSYSFKDNTVELIKTESDERLAQILADFLRKKLLKEGKRFSFETVFSHEGKLDIMREARDAGYKVYLYFVSTESPDINVDRVEYRVANGGHPVDEQKIRSRYYRSLELLHSASQIAYQAFFYDNSGDKPELIAHFKLKKDNTKDWDAIDEARLPIWFRQYYLNKVKT